MKKQDYIIKNAGGRLELHCPRCGEELIAADVENFPRCPFCNQELIQDNMLEDFILDPVITTWVRKNPMNSR